MITRLRLINITAAVSAMQSSVLWADCTSEFALDAAGEVTFMGDDYSGSLLDIDSNDVMPIEQTIPKTSNDSLVYSPCSGDTSLNSDDVTTDSSIMLDDNSDITFDPNGSGTSLFELSGDDFMLIEQN